ncbi:hypothetical protein [Kiloniella sp.]|uniref:hypothetical protein n=1 Tax=Kiloniella sp. TaxID=1938587 RepID=UPI003B02761C
MSELSTQQGLSYFPPETKIEITDFGAERFKQYGWISNKNLPKITTIQDLFNYFKFEPDLILIDFDATIENIGSLSTHDDGESHFIFKSKLDCISILEKALSTIAKNSLKTETLDNPGLYFFCGTDGIINKYKTFDEYRSINC